MERARQRRFTTHEVDALVRADGQFEIAEGLGSLARLTPFTNDAAASFMVPVLRKRSTGPGARRPVSPGARAHPCRTPAR